MCIANSHIQVLSGKNRKEGLKTKVDHEKQQPKWAKPAYVRDLSHRKYNGNTEIFKIVKTGKKSSTEV